ncbi:hypothetical protein F5B18DRAFT_645749, partial [Nemania serpens]
EVLVRYVRYIKCITPTTLLLIVQRACASHSTARHQPEARWTLCLTRRPVAMKALYPDDRMQLVGIIALARHKVFLIQQTATKPPPTKRMFHRLQRRMTGALKVNLR